MFKFLDTQSPIQDQTSADLINSILNSLKNVDDIEEARRLAELAGNQFQSYFSESQKKIETLEKIAGYDQLTCLPNRHNLRSRISDEFKRFTRDELPRIITIADIDHFKYVNDTYGHDAGDEVLKAVSKEMSRSIRETDYLGRWGGEEFLMIFTSGDKSGIKKHLNEIRENISQYNILTNDNEKIRVTMSYGAVSISDIPEALYLLGTESRPKIIEALHDSSYSAKENEIAKTIYKCAVRYAQEKKKDETCCHYNNSPIDIILNPDSALELAIEFALKRADQSLYKAKKEGRNRVIIYS
jgi:diguanylate cyclase